MDAPTIVQQIREFGPLFFVLFGAALLSLIWEWTTNSRREEACRDCPDCKRRRAEIAQRKSVQWAKQSGRCPHEGARLSEGTCPLCQTKWW